MPKSGQFTEYKCGICENDRWRQKSHLTSHQRTKTHKDRETIVKLKLEKLTPEELQTKYDETDVKKILEKIVNLVKTNRTLKKRLPPFTRYKRSCHVVYQRRPQEIEETKQEERFKALFVNQLKKWHNLLRGVAVTGSNAMDDILYCLFLCYLSSKVSTEGDFDLANSTKSCYRGIIQRKVKDYSSKINIDYLINNTAELGTTNPNDNAIYKIGELLSRHPRTKQLIKNKLFIHCTKPIILVQLLKECKEFSTTHNIFSKIDIVGYVWEYFNTNQGGNRGTSKELGQYFTERPIMGLCCQLIELSHLQELGIDKNSTLGDEFCATFGFPLYTKKFLKDNFNIPIQDKNVYGVELEDRLSRLGIMNAMFSLSVFKHVQAGDSFITNISPHIDLSLHNVPFGKSMDWKRIKKSYNDARSKSDSHLPEFNKVISIEKNGDAMLAAQVVVYKTKKMGLLIIKDGEETSGLSNKKWREWFCDTCVIHKIMKIPTGAFSHTGTKTVCIYFTKREGQKTERIQFLEMSDIGDKITEICEVTRSDLQQNTYSWDPNVYLVDEEKEKLMASSSCEWKKLGELCDIEQGTSLPKKNMVNGEYPVIGGGKIIGTHNINNRNGVETTITRVGELPVSFINEMFYLTENGFSIKHSNNITNKFIYYILTYTSLKSSLRLLYGGSGQPVISKTKVENFEIPIPLQETQTQVVQKLDDLSNQRQNYMDIREGLERRMNYYFEMMIKKHREEITMEKLGELCDINYGDRITKKKEHNPNGKYSVYGGGNCSDCFRVDRYNREGETCKISRFAASLHNCVLLLNAKYFLNDSGLTLNSNNHNLNHKYMSYYMYYSLNNNETLFKSLYRGADQQNLDITQFKNLDIAIPPKETQTQVVQYLDEIEQQKDIITKQLTQIDTLIRDIVTQSYQ